MSRIVLAALAIALVSAAPASAQLMGSRELSTTAIVKGAPATKPAPDIYYLAGESGAEETYILTIKGPASLSLFAPDGREMISATGSGKLTLKAVLSLTDVFTLAVSRIDPKQPYTLSRRATIPTLAEAENANHVGFTYKSDTGALVAQCWIKPGVKFRLKTDQETREHTLAADRATTTIVTRKGNASVTYETSYAVVANQVKTTDRYPTGTVKEYSSDLVSQDFAMNGDPPSQFTGYLCKD